uniref:G protein-coupled receptor n=1 Tax=Panagrellus redivivus TaxID=6233 RepID=A0A7E4VEF0_PANRE
MVLDDCYVATYRVVFIQMYTMIASCIICVILTIGSIIGARFNTTFKGNLTATKIERRLLLQCSISTVLFTMAMGLEYSYMVVILNQEVFYFDEDGYPFVDLLVDMSNMFLRLLYTTDALMLLLIR